MTTSGWGRSGHRMPFTVQAPPSVAYCRCRKQLPPSELLKAPCIVPACKDCHNCISGLRWLSPRLKTREPRLRTRVVGWENRICKLFSNLSTCVMDCPNVGMHAHAHVCLCTHRCMCMHTCTHTCMHRHTRMHTHTIITTQNWWDIPVISKTQETGVEN